MHVPTRKYRVHPPNFKLVHLNVTYILKLGKIIVRIIKI